METILLTLSIISGQLLKLSIGTQGGLTALDIAVIFLCIWGAFTLKFKLTKPTLWIKTAFIFICIAIVSLLLTPLALTQNELFTAFSYTIRFFLYIFLGWLIYSGAFNSLKNNTQLVLIISASILAILGFAQFIFLPDLSFLIKYGWDPHYSRAASTFFDPNFLGSFLVLSLITLTKQKRGKIFYALFTFLYIALLVTFSRGAYLAFLSGFLAYSVLNKSLQWGIVTIFLFLVLMLGFTSYQKQVAEPRNIDRDKSALARLDTWQQGIALFQLHPMLGVGFNAYRYGIREYNLGNEQFLNSHGSSTNDSSLLYVASTTGSIGLISYLIFLGTLIKQKNTLLTSALFALLAQSFFANTLFYPHLLIAIILMAIARKK